MAVLGGLVWIAAAVIGWGANADPTVFLAGQALLVLSLAAGGYALVATPCLGYMVWITIRDAFTTDHVPVLVVGVLMVAAGLIGLGRTGRATTHPEPVRDCG